LYRDSHRPLRPDSIHTLNIKLRVYPTLTTPPDNNRLALANEKRRKRRESHNAVERRRRDNINEKIQELALLLPEEWLEGPTSPIGNAAGKGPTLAGLLSGTVSGSALNATGGPNASLDDEAKEIKANKGVILRNSVEYIKYAAVFCQFLESFG